MKITNVTIVACLCLAISCAGTEVLKKEEVSQKIKLYDYEYIDEDGLRGPADGKVSVGFQFVIPNTKKHRAEVKAIDPDIRFAGSSSYFCMGNHELLCKGSTHKKDYRKILLQLAELPYIKSIDEEWLE